MSNESIDNHAPTDIKLHQNTRVLEIAFDNGSRFSLPCEYLRVFSPSAEVKAMKSRGQVVTGKQGVNITQITPVGNYAIQLNFDDGHHTGVYSWSTLYDLGVNQERNWQDYQDKLKVDDASVAHSGPITVRILYFVNLPDDLGIDSEQTELPESVTHIQELVEWLKRRGQKWDKALAKYPLKITVNKQFVEPDVLLKHNDEVAIVPAPSGLSA